MTRQEAALIAATRAALADGTARTRRLATGIRLREFADLLDVSTATVSQWERQDAENKPLRVPGQKNALAYGRELAALERNGAEQAARREKLLETAQAIAEALASPEPGKAA